MHKSLVFLYIHTNNKLSERRITKTNPFLMGSKRIKYPAINWTKAVKDLYSESYKAVMKDIRDETNKCKSVLCVQTGRINIVKMSISPR